MFSPVVIDWAGEALELLPERAALLRDHATLLVADLHVGKAHAFRREGLPVPHGTTGDTLARLDALVRRTGATRVVFLGDLLHSRHAQDDTALDELRRWRRAHSELALTLVRGNHDAHAGDPPDALDIRVVSEPHAVGRVHLCHHPEGRARRGAAAAVIPAGRIAGHVHPCVIMRGGLDRLRLPCFHARSEVLVLPAFGAFTGMQEVSGAPGERLWAIAGERVMALPVAPGA